MSPWQMVITRKSATEFSVFTQDDKTILKSYECHKDHIERMLDDMALLKVIP